jgi:hypothetical protein
LAGIQLAKQQGTHFGRPAGRAAEKVANALEKGLSVVEIVTRTRSSQASIKHYQHEWRAIAAPLAALVQGNKA